MKCLECGHDLIEMHRYPVGFIPDKQVYGINYWSYSHTEYKGHCENCLCDWEWDEFFEKNAFRATQPKRIFWG